MKKRISITIMVLTLIGVLLTACTTKEDSKGAGKDRGEESQEDTSANESTNTNKNMITPAEPSREEKIELQLQEMLVDMTQEEKIGQLFMVAFRLDEENKPILTLTDSVKADIQKYKIGGVCLFGENIDNPQQTKTLTGDLQHASSIPLFISTDEEGGMVSRIGKNPKMEEQPLPDMAEIGKTGDPKEAYKVGVTLGKLLLKYGMNVDFAPVADVNTNPDNPIIGVRSFGDDPILVGEMVAEEVKGIQEQGVSACAKHFPGHGDTEKDSHKGQVMVNHDINRLRTVEWIPFIDAIKAGVDFVMVGHIMTPNVTNDNKPASLSKEMMTNYLRGELGFEGIVITDALEMKAISEYYKSGQASIEAFMAGADIILMPANWKNGYDAVLEAAQNEQIPKERINHSVARILRTKLQRGVIPLK